MARYETFCANLAEAPNTRTWVCRALLLSLVLHAALFIFFHFKKIGNFSLREEASLARPVTVLRQTVLEPKRFEDDPAEARKLVSSIVGVPIEEPEPKESTLSQGGETSLLLSDKPELVPFNSELLREIEGDTARDREKELGDIAAVLEAAPLNPPQTPIELLNRTDGDEFAVTQRIKERQSLDDALSGTGNLNGKPVAMPGGALFEHDKAELMPAAVGDLQKLAQLVARFPNATFIISGHTDWTGTPDYNLRLSGRRAEAVKEWLVADAGVSADRIQTIGCGSAEAIVPADRSINEQQPNRRVEIVIKTNIR